jgi:hypothetical protein
MGPRDEGQLGPGWYHREIWGSHGAMRWTRGEAVAYLSTTGQASALRVRVYSGEPRLGPVEGRVVVHHTAAGDGAVTTAERAFALPPDTWEELTVPVPSILGQLRVTIHVSPLRVPRERIPGSQDDRGLGLAVKRLSLA